MSNFPASGIVPTIDRPDILRRTLESLCSQDWQPREIVIVDASHDDRTRDVIASLTVDFSLSGCRLIWQRAIVAGAASQRSEGVTAASQPVIWFFDDDILFEPHCVERLWSALQSDAKLGGVNAMIVNQHYRPPRCVSQFMFRLMAGKAQASYAGQVLGPVINLLPEDREDLPDVVPVEWLNTTCTLYRRVALPDPAFPRRFLGYSLGEDIVLSMQVGRQWKLANARTARIFHDSQPGAHKDDAAATSRMAVVNRYYIMTDVLGRRSIKDRTRFIIWELFQIMTGAVQQRLSMPFWRSLQGKLQGVFEIASTLGNRR
jgi:glycosyltransferase involved in cell wall biosynthesis